MIWLLFYSVSLLLYNCCDQYHCSTLENKNKINDEKLNTKMNLGEQARFSQEISDPWSHMIRSQFLSSSNNQSIKHRHLVVGTLESPPFMMKRQSSDVNGTIEWYGYCMDFFHELIKHLPYKVTYEIYQVADNKFGSKTKQIIMETVKGNKYPKPKKLESWSGLIGDLQRGKASLALAPLAVMAERELAIDFTVPFYDLVGIQILLKKPEVPQDWFKFLTVLDREVWFSITLAYFFTSFIIFLFDRLSPHSHRNLKRIRRISENRKREAKLNESPTTHSYGQINSISESINGQNYGGGYLTKLSSGHKIKLDNPSTNDMSLKIISQPHDEIRRRTSTLLFSSFDPTLKNRDVQMKSDELPTGRRLSRDYLHILNSRRSFGSWTQDGESELSEQDDGKPDFGLKDSLWFCITSLTPQGGGEAPQNLSGRVVAGAWWLFCFIVIASYTANLAAFLTVSRLDIPIESLDDLAKQYRIKYAPVDGTAEQTYFERMAYIEEIFYNIWKEMSLNDSLSEEERSKFAVWDYPISDKYTKIWAQIQEVGMPQDIEAGIRRVKNSNLDDGFALLADANLVKHAVMTDCSFKAVGDEFSRKPIALGVQKGDEQLRDDISYAILQLINQRFMEVLREKWWTNNPMRITCENHDESEGISFENIGGVFIIILAGVILSFFVWAIERFVYKVKIEVSRGLIGSI